MFLARVYVSSPGLVVVDVGADNRGSGGDVLVIFVLEHRFELVSVGNFLTAVDELETSENFFLGISVTIEMNAEFDEVGFGKFAVGTVFLHDLVDFRVGLLLSE